HSGGISSTSNVSLYNCIIANNSSPSGADVYLNDTFLGSAQNNIVETCFNASSICPSWFSTADPLLIVGLGNNGGPTQTLALNSGSPAIDMGLATYQQYFDQRGELRCPISDIGAYEFNPGTNNVETLQVTECVQYTVPSGDETYSTSGIYQDTLPNSTGCDSILTIDLTIPVPASGIDSLTACDSLVWIDGITYFTDNNTATFNIIGGTINGCDSLVTLYLTVLQSMSGTDAQTACDSLVWIDGLTYFTDNNTATFNFTGGAANGCDSLVTLELTINAINPLVTQTGTLLTSDETGATYQWLNCPAMTTISGATNQSFTATTNGDYAVTLTKNGCTDTSTCYSVTGVGIIENNFGNELLIYPNPTDGNFSIDLGNNYQTTVITITDVNGRIIQTKSYTDSQLLDLKPEEPTGIYFLIIESERKKAVIRLIKE
ncbi:MAG: choice-of-anchor Q domain-containing protein, partial [Crocinitomicaceae bacterium]